MNNFMQKFKSALYKISYGRYGTDELSRFLLISGLVCFGLFFITGVGFLYPLSIMLLIYNVFRSYSKNYNKRYKEREIYLFYKSKADKKISLYRRMWNERKTHKFFKCPTCKTVVRVPKGRGKIEISCPKCHNNFVRKS